MHQGTQTAGKIIDRTRGKIEHAVGDLTGNRRLKREGRTLGQVKGAAKDATRAVNGRIRN